MRLEFADDELFENAGSASLHTRSRQGRGDEGLDVLEVRQVLVHLGRLERIEA